MHEALVERLAPAAGEQWLDLGCGAGDVAFLAAHAGAIVTGSDLSPDARRRGTTPRGGAGSRPHARGGRLPEPPLRRCVVRCRLVVGRRDLRAGPPACRPGAGPGLPPRRPPRHHRLAQVTSGVGEMFAVMAPFMPPPPPGVGSPFQWGDEAMSSRMLGDAFDLTFEELDTRHEGDDGARDVGVLPRQLRPSFTLWSSLDEERRAATRCGHDGVFRELSRRTTGSASSGATSSPRACARAEPGVIRVAGSRGPRR